MQIAWLLFAHLGIVTATAGVVEVDLVSPRNDTYAPSSTFPFIFAFQISGLAALLNPRVYLRIWKLDDGIQTPETIVYDLRWANFSSADPYYEHKVLSFSQEARWKVIWEVVWDHCTLESLEFAAKHFTSNSTTSGRTIFTMSKSGGKQMDLISATENRNCSENEGVAISIATTMPVPEYVTWEKSNGSLLCASMANTTLAPTPCKVKIEGTASASLTSAIACRVCRATRKPGDSCLEDEEKSASERLTGGFGAILAAALGGSKLPGTVIVCSSM